MIRVDDRQSACGFTGELLDGGSLSLSQDAGRVVVVNFWATWCPPCAVETPQLDAMYRLDKSKGMAFIGVATKNTRDAVRSFVQANDISYPMLLDEPGEVAVALGNLPGSGPPFSVLVDKHQRVAAVYVGAVAPKDLQPVLDQLVGEA